MKESSKLVVMKITIVVMLIERYMASNTERHILITWKSKFKKDMVSIIDILLGSSSSSSNDEDDKQKYLTEGSRLVFGENEYNNH